MHLKERKLLRVGFILEDDVVPFWINEIIKKAGIVSSTQVVILIMLAGTKKTKPGPPFTFFSSIDQKILPAKHLIASLLKVEAPYSTSFLRLTSVKNEFDNLALDKIRESKPDVIIHFGQSSLPKAILSIPSKGIWSITFNNTLGHSYAGFWEWFHKEPTNVVAIAQKNENALVSIIATEVTESDYLSLSRNQTLVFSRAIDLVINTLNRVSAQGEIKSPKYNQEIPSRKEPNLLNIFFAFIKLFSRLLYKTLLKIFFIEQWALFTSPRMNFPDFDFSEFRPILPPKDRFWADPFVVSQDDKHYIFIEELPFKTKKGHLTCLVVNNEGEVENSQVILEKAYHLSYPFVFKHHDKWLMIPESGENSTVDLYECLEFPFKWQLKKTLLQGFQVFDSTLHFVNDRIWLFCTIKQSESGSPNDDLYLFSTDNLFEGKWIPHPQNPVVSDPYNARPAGKIFEYEGDWYRPSQVCVPRYGYALAINRIDQLDETTYRETRVTQTLPNWHNQLISNHTYNSSTQLTITDGILRRFRF